MTQQPIVTYIYNMPGHTLADFWSEEVYTHLSIHQMRVCMAIRDTSDIRAGIVRQLNRRRIPVVAWIVPDEHATTRDYRMHDAEAFSERYQHIQQWSIAQGLRWDAIGIDIEPDIRDTVRFGDEPKVDYQTLIQRFGDRWHIDEATTSYQAVMARIHADGYQSESYEVPFVRDDRVSQSTVARRLLGLPNLATHHTVVRLCSSAARPYGPGLIATYAPEYTAVIIGSVDDGDDANHPMSLTELLRDVAHVASCGIKRIYITEMAHIFANGWHEHIAQPTWWRQPLPVADENHRQVARMRAGLRALLWAGARPAVLLPLLIPVLLLVRRMLRHETASHASASERSRI
jgi:hypothetical protein